jgi:hypothetical protein
MIDSKLERKIANRLVETLLGCGYAISIDDGENETAPMTDQTRIVNDMAAVSMERLYVWRNDAKHDGEQITMSRVRHGWVLMVYGNEIDVLTDYTTNLEGDIKPVNDWIYSKLNK